MSEGLKLGPAAEGFAVIPRPVWASLSLPEVNSVPLTGAVPPRLSGVPDF